jgi:MFS transporter, VNT family, synaptic vesicle glycoprotein 2
MAAALSLTFGRGGALMGNLLFGFLIDLNCVVPIVVFAVMLLSEYQCYFLHKPVFITSLFYQFTVSGLLCLMLPNTGQEALD